MGEKCPHCQNGNFDNRFGEDVECVNGVLIDIDRAYEGWDPHLNYPVAPCHPMWARQQAGDEDFDNDCQERLEAWADCAPDDTALHPSETAQRREGDRG